MNAARGGGAAKHLRLAGRLTHAGEVAAVVAFMLILAGTVALGQGDPPMLIAATRIAAAVLAVASLVALQAAGIMRESATGMRGSGR